MKWLLMIPLALFGALAVAFYIGMSNGDQALPSTMIGREAPAVATTALGDLPLATDADLRVPGVKLVNFWASWCAPCRAEHPMLEALAKEGVTVIGMNYKDKAPDALGFLAEMGNPYAKIAADDTGRVGIDWGIYGVPETFVINGAGKVVARLAGPITSGTLDSVIRPAMAEAAK